MTQSTTGWMLFAGAMGMILTLLAGDVMQLKSLHEIDPAFIAGVMAHLGAVLGAFAGGKFVNSNRMDAALVSDQKRAELSKE